MTEANIPLYGKINELGNGTCGKVYKKYFEVEIRDPNTDEKKKDGEIILEYKEISKKLQHK